MSEKRFNYQELIDKCIANIEIINKLENDNYDDLL